MASRLQSGVSLAIGLTCQSARILSQPDNRVPLNLPDSDDVLPAANADAQAVWDPATVPPFGSTGSSTLAAPQGTGNPRSAAEGIGQGGGRPTDGEENSGRTDSLARQLIESIACLAMAVIFFRAFILEGYIISTGSMAPHLLGYHKRIKCPDCEFEFAFGTAFDQAVPASSRARCPNCGQDNIDTARVPRNDGDQLLVFKYAYLNSDPDRWEIVVFLNPANPTQAYVKRLVGRPGETIEVYDGDVLIDGHLARKPIDIQRATRIAVFDHDHPADRKDWLPRWLADGKWSRTGRDFVLNQNTDFVDPVTQGPSGPVRTLGAAESILPYESMDESMTATGSGEWNWCHYLHWPRDVNRDRIHEGSADPVEVAPDPISDRYGYNRFTRSTREFPVHDLMWNGRVRLGRTGQFSVAIHNRDRWGVCILDIDRARLDTWVVTTDELDRPFDDPNFRPHLSVPLRGEWMTPEIDLEVSGFDYQLCVAVNGKPLIQQAFETAGKIPGESGQSSSRDNVVARLQTGAADTAPRSEKTPGDVIRQTAFRPKSYDPGLTPSRIHFGGRNGTFLVKDLTIYRDVHYTATPGGHAVGRPYPLGDDEFFFLGDNSPVSLDSRGWKDPVVPRHLIVGKPMVVHLPSRPGRIRLGGREWFFRVPDFSRIRYIR